MTTTRNEVQHLRDHCDAHEASQTAWETPEELRIVLVYQGGIANVFKVTSFNLSNYGRDAERIMQRDFSACEYFARGCGYGGAIVRTAACNQAGDIVNALWSEDLENQPFSDKFNPVKYN